MAASGIPPVSIDWQVNITSILVGIVAVIGHIGSFFSMKTKVDTLAERLRDMESKSDTSERDLNTFQLQAADRYVKRDDMREVEARLTSRMASVEHEVRQIPMKLAGLIKAGAHITD